MKKILSLLIICFLFLPFFVYADEDSPQDAPAVEDEEPVRRELRLPNRGFEVGINVGVGFANNVLTINEIFQDTLILDIDKFADGLKINLGVAATPLYFKYDSKRGWGFGLSSGVDAVGILDLSGDMLSFKMVEDSKSNLSGAVFGSIGIDTFFQIQKFKIKFRPAVYYTFAYIKPDISYTYNKTDQDTQFFIALGLQIFTAYSIDNSKLTAEPGVDFSFTVEYPLSKETGMSEKYPILDFDLGIDFVNIPIASSTVKSYMEINTVLGSKEPVEFDEELMSAFELGDSDPVYGEGNEKVFRPFKMLLWADWRPFPDNVPISIIPTIGFSVSQIFAEQAAIEGGFKIRLDLANRFLATLGIGYYDRLWQNSLDLTLNFRAVELNLGADLRAPEFAKSWDSGFGLRFGLKFGW